MTSSITPTKPKLTQIEPALHYAKVATSKRMESLRNKSLTMTEHSSKLRARMDRLAVRMSDLEAIPALLEDNHLSFKGFCGWDDRNVETTASRSGVSQFDSVIAETPDGQQIKIPLESRYRRSTGDEIDFIKEKIPHEDHSHIRWTPHTMKGMMLRVTRFRIKQDEEGCPCCIAGLDFDEFAAATKEIVRSPGHQGQWAGWADFNTPAHWATFLGVAAPFGLVGIAAAMRNIKGAAHTFKHLSTIIQGIKQDIHALKKSGHHADIHKLEAFKRCLEYSRMDAAFNWTVPGVINLGASSLVLSTGFSQHPFALPVIALYATGQVGRNVYDSLRVLNHGIKPDSADTHAILAGKNKVNQIARSKFTFYAANTLAFSAFALGATITFLSIPAMGIAGAGLLSTPVGLSLLFAGAAITGYMNNKWPRKFKPRNGDLGIPRMELHHADDVLKEIAWRRDRKKIIQTTFGIFKSKGQWKKRYLKVMSALPEMKDFLPSNGYRAYARVANNRLKWLPSTGSLANNLKHQLNLKLADELHADPLLSRDIQRVRLSTLDNMITKSATDYHTHSDKQLFTETWSRLKQLHLDKDVVNTWLNDGFVTHPHDNEVHQPACCGHDHPSHNHEAAEIKNTTMQTRLLNQEGHLKQTAQKKSVPGLIAHAPNWSSFSAELFWEQSTEEEKSHFNAAIDYFLFNQYPKTLTYQTYGLYDYFQQLRRLPAENAQTMRYQ